MVAKKLNEPCAIHKEKCYHNKKILGIKHPPWYHTSIHTNKTQLTKTITKRNNQRLCKVHEYNLSNLLSNKNLAH